MQKKRFVLIGIFSGITVFVFGFGMLYLMWLMIGSPQGLPGFFSYRAATIGDGICLPMLIGSAVAFRQCNRGYYNHVRKTNLILSFVAALVAVIVQASWLISDDTVLNWSIPIQHHFNIAGWYHSLFFVVIFGVVTYQLCGIWFILKERKTEYLWSEKVVYGLFVFGGALFLLMHVADDYSQYLPMPILLSITAAGFVLMLLLYVKSTNGTCVKELLAGIIMGVIGAHSVSLAICLSVKGDLAIALAGGLCACFIWRVEKNSITKLLVKDAFTIVVCTWSLYVISGLSNVTDMIIMLVLLSVCIFLLEYLSVGEMRNRCFSVIFVGIYILLNYFSWEMIDSSINIDIVQVIFTGAVVLFFSKEIRGFFSTLIISETKKNKNQISKIEFLETKSKVYLQIVIGIMATAILLAHWLSDIVKTRESRIETGSLNSLSWSVLCVLVAVILLLSIFGMEKLRKHMFTKMATILVDILIIGILIVLLIINIEILPELDWTLVKWGMMVCSMFACIGAALLSAHGYYMNVVLLRGFSRKCMALAMSIIQFIGNLILNIAIAVLLLSRQTRMNLLLIMFVTIVAYVVLPLLHARVIQYGKTSFHVVGNNVFGGIAQDGLTVSMIIIFVICMPCLYISINNEVDVNSILEVVTLIILAFEPIKFCIHNNVEHMERQKEVLKDYPEEEEMWNVLHKCLVRQSKQTIFAMLPYVCIVAGAEVGKKLCQSRTWKEAIKELINYYIDKDKYGEEDAKDEEDTKNAKYVGDIKQKM